MSYKDYLKIAYRLGKMIDEDESMVARDDGLYVNGRKIKNPSWYLGVTGLSWSEYINMLYRYLEEVSSLLENDCVKSVCMSAEGVDLEYSDGEYLQYSPSDIMCLLDDASNISKILEGYADFDSTSIHKYLTESGFNLAGMSDGRKADGYVLTKIPGKEKIRYSLYTYKDGSIIAVCRSWGPYSDCRMYALVHEYYDEYPLCNWNIEFQDSYGFALISCPISAKFQNDIKYLFSVFKSVSFKYISYLAIRNSISWEVYKGIAPVKIGHYEFNRILHECTSFEVDVNEIPYIAVKCAIQDMLRYEGGRFLIENGIDGVLDYNIGKRGIYCMEDVYGLYKHGIGELLSKLFEWKLYTEDDN